MMEKANHFGRRRMTEADLIRKEGGSKQNYGWRMGEENLDIEA